ncbi:hypothetical protein BGZ58_002433 [Dissophora ornata]|nr:hypothetical protein BGZ58_002433 [Dissophora ornata]
MSPTEQSFGTTIEGRFASSSSSSSFSHQSPFPLTEQRLPWTDMAHYSALDTFSSPSSGPLSTTGSTTAVSPRPLSFHWDSYDAVEEDEDEQDDRDSDEEAETDYHHENSRMSNNSTYHRQFEGHHSMVRRRSSMGGGGGGGSFEKTYDSLRHGIGLNVSDMSEELAKARSKMSRTSRAMKSMEQELEAMQLSIDESKASSASTRTAIEENFWRLECLALTIESDRQETNKRLQTVGRECSEAVEEVTNWEVRIDWLEKRVDNTSEYVSELVLSEQECMSFIKMIIQQNQHPIMPPKPPQITAAPDESQRPDSAKKAMVEPPAELWRDFSRLTTAFESGQVRTPFSPFQRTRSRSTGQGALVSTTGLGSSSNSCIISSSSSSSSNSGAGVNSNSLFKSAMTRRPQVENLSSMPKILPPAVPTTKLPAMKRRNQNLSHLPVHSWLQFQFNKTMTTPGGLGPGGSKKKTNVLGFQPITIFQTTV